MVGAGAEGWGGGKDRRQYLIINGNRIFNSLILVIRPKCGFYLQVYSEIVIKI